MTTLFDRPAARPVVILTAMWILAATAWFLVTAVNSVDGVDLYFYACHGRDFAQGYTSSQDFAYIYFPGVFRFWAAVFSVLPVSTLVVQRIVIGMLAGNAVLIAMILRGLTGQWFSAIVGCGLYIAVASRFEGLSGTSEPIATLAFLAGIAALVFCRREGMRLLLFALSLGVTVYVKQQAGLLAIGTAWYLLSASGLSEKYQRIGSRFYLCCGIAIAATTAFLALILCEGRGLMPLWSGLSMAAGYEQHGGLLWNLYSIVRNDESLILLALLPVCVPIAFFRRSPLLCGVSQEVCGVLLIAAAATLIQFRTRGYYHYLLLSLPALVIAFVVVGRSICERFSQSTWLHRCARSAVVVAAILVFGHVGQRNMALNVFSVPGFPTSRAESLPWHQQPEVSRSLDRIRAALAEGTEAFVLPPGRPVVFFRTQTVNPLGYAFGEFVDMGRSSPNDIDAAIVLDPRITDRDRAAWTRANCDLFRSAVRSDPRFEQIGSAEVLTLFVRRK